MPQLRSTPVVLNGLGCIVSTCTASTAMATQACSVVRRGAQADGFPAFHTVLVSDSRRRSGENAAMARVIASLPFTDTGDSSGFADNYRCQATVGQLNMVDFLQMPLVDDMEGVAQSFANCSRVVVCR